MLRDFSPYGSFRYRQHSCKYNEFFSTFKYESECAGMGKGEYLLMVGEKIPEQCLFPQFLSVFLRFRLKECCLPLLSMRRLLNEFLLWKEFIRLNSQPIVWLSEMEGGGEHWGYCLAFVLWIFFHSIQIFFHCGRGSAGRSLITCLPFVFALRMHNLFCFVLFFC